MNGRRGFFAKAAASVFAVLWPWRRRKPRMEVWSVLDKSGRLTIEWRTVDEHGYLTFRRNLEAFPMASIANQIGSVNTTPLLGYGPGKLRLLNARTTQEHGQRDWETTISLEEVA